MLVIALDFVLLSHAPRLTYVPVRLARVDQDVAWIRQSYLEECKKPPWNLILDHGQITQTKLFKKRRWCDDLQISSWLGTCWSCQLLVGFMDSKSSHVHFLTSLPIQSTYGVHILRTVKILFQSLTWQHTKYLFNFGEALSDSISLSFLSRSVSKSSGSFSFFETHNRL